jgi:hypothetical protein
MLLLLLLLLQDVQAMSEHRLSTAFFVIRLTLLLLPT